MGRVSNWVPSIAPLFSGAVLARVPVALLLCACGESHTDQIEAVRTPAPTREKTVHIQYLEFVTPDVDNTCSALEKLHGVAFGPPKAALGNARTATLEHGRKLGVRAPMRPDENPVVRPYVLTADIDAAIETARAAGAEIALPPMELPGHGRCAIYIQGGIEHGLWQL